ncbi:MAG: phosphatidylcholine/phosphatidylserine synthase [Rhodanobacter sp.]|jgi:CDP-diacylglycerol--serine O-phosphatidyltransferase|nr:phosphatidylcholine/phosphatidylserine synthase [Rhodanobacter sp.]
MGETSTGARKPPRGIYLLPNLFTTCAMFAGFYAIIAGIGGHYTDAAIAVFIAGIFDSLDGRVARLTGTQSEFGVQYDSLSDLVSFGLAPALVLYTWSLSALKAYGSGWGKLGWAAAFIYTACAALRLARFNTQVGVADKRYFQGLSSPAAAGLCMSFVWAIETKGLFGQGLFGLRVGDMDFVTPVIAIVAGLLMISRVRYFSFKTWPKSERVPFIWIPVVILVLAALAVDTPHVLFTMAVVYVLSGPALTLWGLRHKRSLRAQRGSGKGEE